jgi:hypothetical protein
MNESSIIDVRSEQQLQLQPDRFHENNDVLDINGQRVTLMEALSAANAVFAGGNATQSLVDACLIEQFMADYAIHGKLTTRSSSFDEMVSDFRHKIVSERIDQWWDRHCDKLEVVTAAWMSLRPASGTPIQTLAGNLASNPSAAIISARCEGRRGGFIEYEISDLPAEFEPLEESPIGAVVSLEEMGDTTIGIVLDRAPTPLNDTTRPLIEQRVFNDWLIEARAGATVRWLWASGAAESK